MTPRQSMSPKLRFEVFKRDKFTCQYCGAKAPDVLLQVDHLHPVAEGGGNDILNLITSCQSCNGGKGAVPLSDTTALNRQRDALADLEDRRQGDEPTLESWGAAFSKIPGVADIKRQESEKPYLRRLFYIQGIIRNRSRARRYNCVEYLEHLVLCGADLDDMEVRAKRLRTLEDFEGPYDAWLDSIGRPF